MQVATISDTMDNRDSTGTVVFFKSSPRINLKLYAYVKYVAGSFFYGAMDTYEPHIKTTLTAITNLYSVVGLVKKSIPLYLIAHYGFFS